MIFYGTGIVWDKENDRPLCRFVGGKYETSDSREIRLLEQMQERQGQLSAEDALKRRLFEERMGKMSLANMKNARLPRFKIVKIN
jgi:hypothetical protein